MVTAKTKAYCIKLTLQTKRVIAKGFKSEDERSSALMELIKQSRDKNLPMKIESFEIWYGEKFQWSRVALSLCYDSIPKRTENLTNKIMEEVMFYSRLAKV